MRNSRILAINLGALNNEVVKALVLAGIGSLTILDSSTVQAEDLGAQFFLEESDIGKNAAKFRIQRLNPRVSLEIDQRPLDQIDDAWLQEFDVVVATELPYKDLVRINAAARKVRKSFYAAGLFGMSGYVFADLVEHRFQM